jgi:hypothetical protein
MADYFCSGMGSYVVKWPTIFAMVWAAMCRGGRLFLQSYGQLHVVRWPALFAAVCAAM